MSASTPPPPSSHASFAPPSEPEQPGLSESARLINVFIAPRKTFVDLRRNASWWVPWLVTTLVGLVFAILVVQKVDLVRLSQHQVEQSKMAQRQMEQLSPEQQEQQLQLRAKITKFAFYISPLFGLVFGLVVAALLLAVFNFGFGAEISFGRALAVVFYASLPRAVYALLLCLSLLLSSDANSIDIVGNPMPTNLAFFMDPQGNKFLYSLMSNLDLFAIWTVVLMGLGFATASTNQKPSAGSAMTTMLLIYGVLILIGAGFRAAF